MAVDAPTGPPRPGAISLNIKEKSILYAAYMPFVKGGGIFIPTARSYKLGDEIFMLISLMDDQQSVSDKGGTMRLGTYACRIADGSQSHKAYGVAEVKERHRHRYEFNNAYRDILTKQGLVLSGLSPDGRLVEIVELRDHPWFVATQFHPEFNSRPHHPHPLFSGFVGAALKRKCGR